MDKYDSFLADVLEKTKSGSLIWRIEDLDSFAVYVPEFKRIIQGYSTEYKPDYKKYTLLFVEKTYWTYFPEVDSEGEAFTNELYVIHNGKRIFTLDSNFVDASELSKLRELLKTENVDANEFFSSFEQVENEE